MTLKDRNYQFFDALPTNLASELVKWEKDGWTVKELFPDLGGTGRPVITVLMETTILSPGAYPSTDWPSDVNKTSGPWTETTLG
jgi:hypothetical protein